MDIFQPVRLRKLWQEVSLGGQVCYLPSRQETPNNNEIMITL